MAALPHGAPPPTVLTYDQRIQLAHDGSVSFLFNPRNLEDPHRPRAELLLAKLGNLLSPSNRCLNYTEFRFWLWVLPVNNTAAADGTGSEQTESDVSITSTVHPRDLRYRACDSVLVYACLPLVIDPEIGLPEPSSRWPRVPLTLVELKKNASRQLVGDERITDLKSLLEQAKVQVGTQAGYMFGNQAYRRQPYVIAVVMAAEYWSYALFYQTRRPGNFNSTEAWKLPPEQWAPAVFWGSLYSNLNFLIIRNYAVQLLAEMNIPLV